MRRPIGRPMRHNDQTKLGMGIIIFLIRLVGQFVKAGNGEKS